MKFMLLIILIMFCSYETRKVLVGGFDTIQNSYFFPHSFQYVSKLKKKTFSFRRIPQKKKKTFLVIFLIICRLKRPKNIWFSGVFNGSKMPEMV